MDRESSPPHVKFYTAWYNSVQTINSVPKFTEGRVSEERSCRNSQRNGDVNWLTAQTGRETRAQIPQTNYLHISNVSYAKITSPIRGLFFPKNIRLILKSSISYASVPTSLCFLGIISFPLRLQHVENYPSYCAIISGDR